MICVCHMTGELYIKVHVYLYITPVFCIVISCICMIFHVFEHSSLLCYVLNTHMTYHIYHFINQSQYVVQLLTFYLTNITYVRLYSLISNCSIIYYVKVYCNIFCHIVTCHKLMYNTICFLLLCSEKL